MNQEMKSTEEFLTRTKAAKYIGVSLVTFDKWTKEGIVPGYRLGDRKFFKKSEIVENMEPIRTNKYSR